VRALDQVLLNPLGNIFPTVSNGTANADVGEVG
jgi:hypothetical protein